MLTHVGWNLDKRNNGRIIKREELNVGRGKRRSRELSLIFYAAGVHCAGAPRSRPRETRGYVIIFSRQT